MSTLTLATRGAISELKIEIQEIRFMSKLTLYYSSQKSALL